MKSTIWVLLIALLAVEPTMAGPASHEDGDVAGKAIVEQEGQYPGGNAEATPAARPDGVTRWRQDFQVFVSKLTASGYTFDFRRGLCTRGQKDFAKLYSPAEFHSYVDRLNAEVPKLSDEEVVLRLMRLVAGARVAHTAVLPKGRGFVLRLPLDFYWYSDGLAVISATPEYAAALGARVVKIGSMTPDRLLTGLEPYVSHENDAWLRRQAPSLLVTQALLRHLGLLGEDGRVTLTLEKPGAPPFTVSLAPAEAQTTRISYLEALHVSPPLFLSRQETHYWYRYLKDSGTLYIQYNQCGNDPKLPFKEFTRRLLAEADTLPIKRVAIDLRLNGGGNSSVIAPLTRGLASRAKLAGHVYVLVGASTFSSAVMNAIKLRRDLKATLAGEPTGGAPSGYGEVQQFVLPNSGLAVRYSCKYFGDRHERNKSLEPDISAPRTLADAIAGRDPVLEMVIAAQ
jgi:hypothetical protein